MKFPKNVLVVYQGGGYSGCFWEWNAFMFDSEREFVDIHSSGYAGITNPADAYRMYRNIKAGNERDGGVFRITARKPMHTFQAEWNPGFVKGVVNAVWEHYQPSPDLDRVKAHVCCDACGCDIDDPDEIVFVNYQSDHVEHRCSGPITPHTKICGECFTEGRCEHCWENGVDSDEQAYCPDEVEKYGMCEWHYNRQITNLLRDGRIADAGEGHDLIQMFAPVLTGEGQMALVPPVIAASQRAGFDRNVEAICEAVVKFWAEMDDTEREALIMPCRPTTAPHSYPLFERAGIAC